MQILFSWLVSAVVILLLAYLLPGISVSGFFTALLVALVLGLVNAFIRPVLLMLTLPLNIVTLGLFTLVINVLMIFLTEAIVPGFQVTSFLWALIFSVILSLVMYSLRDANA